MVAETGCPAVLSRSEIEAMARRRHQHPKPFMHRGWWVINYRVDEYKDGKLCRPQKQARLAPYGTRWREVETLRDEFISPYNHGQISAGSAVTFKDFVDQVYKRNALPLLEGGSSQDRYAGVLDNYLVPAFGDKMLRDLTYDTVQSVFTKLASEPQEIAIGGKRKDGTVRSEKRILALESRRKIWTVFSAVMEQARIGKRVAANPARDIKLGRDVVGKPANPIITPSVFMKFLDEIAEPYATMIYTDVLTGFRVSELVGLKRKNMNATERTFSIEQKFCRGHWGAPKTDASNTTVIVPRCVIQRILALDKIKVKVRAGRATRVFDVVKKKSPEDLVFQSVQSGTVMNDSNILRRHIKPAGEKVGVPWMNWLVLRHLASTWHKRAGNNPKEAQALLRHEDEQTTLRHYTETDHEDQAAAVDRFEAYFLREARPVVN